jgi:hypothetical protein
VEGVAAGVVDRDPEALRAGVGAGVAVGDADIEASGEQALGECGTAEACACDEN